jgi:excinuclease ABC subunit C
VCVEAITVVEYRKIIRDLVRFFEGKKDMIVKAYRRQMLRAAREKQFEEAALWRNRVHALEHIQDVAMLARDEEIIEPLRGKTDSVSDVSDKQIFSRIEGYDISHVSGSATVASMVVFERGAPSKGEYRKFKINDVEGVNDVASMQEVLRRRFHHTEWRKPDLLLIDGGAPQVHAVEQVVHGELGLSIPIVGIAKGPERKRNDLIFTTADRTLAEACQRHHLVLEQVRDEAHRFAITFHRTLRSKRFLGR